MADHYAELGVPSSATFDEIRKAWRKRAAETHPDRDRTPGAADRFRAAQEAWNVLRDPVRRAAYDDERRARGPNWEAEEAIRARFRDLFNFKVSLSPEDPNESR